MPDVTSVFTLDPPTLTAIQFNNGTFGNGSNDDMFYLTDVQGLDSADIRAPKFKNPVAHGARIPGAWFEDGLEPRFEGLIVVQSVWNGNGIREKRMQMYGTLKAALRDCLASDGTLSWVEDGVGAKSLAVRYEVRLTHQISPDGSAMSFTFGLASEASQPS